MTDTFTVTAWDEKIVSGAEGTPRFAHAHVTCSYTGLIEGTSDCDYLIYYAGEGYEGAGQTAPALERFECSVQGRKGSFVVRHEVGYSESGVQGTFTVIPGSATGELSGLTGTGTISGTSETMNYTFDCSFAEEA